MAELVKTAGNATITYTIDDSKSLTMLKVVASDGIILGAAMESGTAYQTTLNITLAQVQSVIGNNAYTLAEQADAVSASNYLTESGAGDFAGLLDKIDAEEKAKSHLNEQLKAIHARLDRIDDDLIAHYAGISQLVLALSVNPFTSGSAALSLKTYNFSSIGQKVLKQLLHMIPGYDTFKQLQHLDTAALLNNLEGSIDNQAAGIQNTLKSQLETAVLEQANAIHNQASAIASQASALVSVNNANAQLVNALANGANSSVITTLTNNLADAQITYNTSTGTLSTITDQIQKVDKLNNTASQITGFMNSLTSIAKSKTYSGIFGKR